MGDVAAGLAEDGAVVRLTDREALANASAVLQLCAAGRLRCGEKTRRPSAATVGVVAGALAEGDFYLAAPIAAFAWPLIIQAGQLAELSAGRLQLTSRGHSALTRSPQDVIRHMWQRWLGHGVIDEMSRIEEVKGQRSANALSAVKPRRQAVAAALAMCAPGEWMLVDDLFALMRRQNLSPTVARSERSIWKLHITDPQYGSLGYAGYHDWPLLEGRYTLCVLFEYAATLGLIDVAYVDPAGARDDFRDNWGTDELDALSRYDGLRAIRCNSLGAYVLGHAETYQPVQTLGSAAYGVQVLPNLDVVVTGEVSPADRLLLDAFAERSSERVWSLSSGTLVGAIAAGRTLDELRQFLTGRALNELPVVVTTLLDDVATRASRIRDLGLVRVVECADSALAALIARDPKLRSHCYPLGDRHIAVPAQHDAVFRNALQRLGYGLPGGSAALP